MTEADTLSPDYVALAQAYRARFGAEPPVYFMPDALAVEVMRLALAKNEPAAPEEPPAPGCTACVR